MDTKIIAMVVLVGFAALAAPARADSTIKSDDSSVEITVPNGWRQTKPATPKIQIQATNGRSIVVVRVAAKEDFKDLKSFASVGSSRFIKRFVDAEPKTEDVQVNGNPAIRISAEGTQDSGQRRGCVMTFVDAGGTYIEVMGIANASVYAGRPGGGGEAFDGGRRTSCATASRDTSCHTSGVVNQAAAGAFATLSRIVVDEVLSLVECPSGQSELLRLPAGHRILIGMGRPFVSLDT
jgi:hypothetical protein